MVAVLCALATFAVGNRLIEPSPPARLIAGTNFSISSTITAQPACSGAPVLLYPGVTRCLTYTVTNPLTVPITVNSISLSVDPAYSPPAACPASNLDLSQTAFSGSLVVPANNGTNTVNRTIALLNDTANQNACKNVTFHFKYAGSATYVQVFNTSTVLTSSANPSTALQQVTFTATVTPSGSPPGPTTGAVTFKDGSSTIWCESGSGAFNGSTATCKYTMSTFGTHPITAVFTNSDGNFAGSTSNTVNQGVNAIATASSLASSLNPSLYGQSVTFTDTVTSSNGIPAGAVTFYDGAAVVSTSSLNGLGKATFTSSTLTVGTHNIRAVYAGNATYGSSTSNTIAQVVNYTSCFSGNQNGSFTVQSGQAVCITANGKVNGDITVKGGGYLYVNGGSVNGSVTVQSGGGLFVNAGSSINNNITATSPVAFSICGAQKINGSIAVSGATSKVVVGDPTACAGNDINGAVTVTTSAAGYAISGNKINGGVTVTNNSGAGTIAGNTKINGNLACSGNSPAPTNGGKANSVNGSRTGQCAAL